MNGMSGAPCAVQKLPAGAEGAAAVAGADRGLLGPGPDLQDQDLRGRRGLPEAAEPELLLPAK